MHHSSAQSALGTTGRPRRVTWVGITVALALGWGLLSLGCVAPEQRASALGADDAPAVAVSEVGSIDVVESEPVRITLVALSLPADSGWSALTEVDVRAEPAAEPLGSRPSLPDRLGQRIAEAAEVAAALEVATASEKLANIQAQRAAKPEPQAAVMTSQRALQPATKTPTPKPTAKPVVRVATSTPRPATATPRPVIATGGWVELPNVRPIPSAYYSAVHRWDSIVNYFAQVYRVDPDLIRRIIYVESKGYPRAYVASTGVKGLMQIAPVWFKAGEDPYDPWTNIGKGAYILRRGYDAYHTWFRAVTYYCYGPLGRYGANLPTFYADLIFSPIIRSL